MNLYASAFMLCIVSAPAFGQSIQDIDVNVNPRVEVDYDRHYDFQQLASYAWSTDQRPTPNRADHVRILKAVSKSLESRGLTLDPTKPDVRISYRLETEQKIIDVGSRQHQSPWDPTDLETNVAVGGHEEAYLIIEMYETATGKRIWRAKCSHPQPTPDKVERSLYQTVEHLFAAYPGGEENPK
jgi:hypothetical protein